MPFGPTADSTPASGPARSSPTHPRIAPRADAPWPEWARSVMPARLRITLRAGEPVRLPPMPGSTLRGALGHALRHLCCAHRPVCARCRAPHTCTYAYLMETPPPPDTTRMRRYPHAPHPFVIEPGWEGALALGDGGALTLDLLLVGRARQLAPFLVAALDRAASRGLGQGRGRMRLESVRQIGAAVPPSERLLYDGGGDDAVVHPPELPALPPPLPSAGRYAVEFVTPTALVRQGRPLERPDPSSLFRALLRRVSNLAYFHAGGRELPLDFRGLVARADGLRDLGFEGSPAWWKRFSSRQGRRIPMGGAVGTLRFEGELGPLAIFLALGQELHVGRSTTFGLGRFRVRTGPAAPGTPPTIAAPERDSQPEGAPPGWTARTRWPWRASSTTWASSRSGPGPSAGGRSPTSTAPPTPGPTAGPTSTPRSRWPSSRSTCPGSSPAAGATSTWRASPAAITPPRAMATRS